MTAAAVVGLLALPLVAVVCALSHLGVRLSRRRWWWALLPAAIGAGWVAALGLDDTIVRYTAVYAQAWEAITSGDLDALRGGWPARALALSPASLLVGGLAAAVTRLVAELRRPSWRADTAATRTPRRKIAQARRRVGGGKAHPPGGVALGVNDDGEIVTLTREQLAAHALLLGSTGGGKTTTLLQLMHAAVAAGDGLVVLDMKGDDGLAEQVERLARDAGRPFRRWTMNGPTCWNPLAEGDATRLKDKLITGERWSEPHYQRLAERHLQMVLGLLLARPESDRPTLTEVVHFAHPARLERLLRDLPDDAAARGEAYLEELDGRVEQDLKGTISRLALVTESVAGQWLEAAADGDTLDLGQAVQEGTIVLFSLAHSEYPAICAQIGGMVTIEMQSVAADLQRQRGQQRVYFAVDEFSALDGDHLLGLLARGRSAGVSVLLATQELADLKRIDDNFAAQVLGNANIKICHRLDLKDSAEELAAIAGTEQVWEETIQITHDSAMPGAREARGGATGMGSLRQVDRFVVHPNTLKYLRAGQAVVIVKAPEPVIHLVAVVPALGAVGPEIPRDAGVIGDADGINPPPPPTHAAVTEDAQ